MKQIVVISGKGGTGKTVLTVEGKTFMEQPGGEAKKEIERIWGRLNG